jgi:hypothetical protein
MSYFSINPVSQKLQLKATQGDGEAEIADFVPAIYQGSLDVVAAVSQFNETEAKNLYDFVINQKGKRPYLIPPHLVEFGDEEFSIKRFINESGTNYLVLRSSGMPTQTVSDLENFYVHYNKIMREFWKDDRIIQYALVLQPYLHVNKSISGISFGNGFIGKYDKPDSLAVGERMGVIAHEIGHYYLSDLKATAGSNSEGQWFNEGFNDYLTFYNLIRAGLIDAAEFEKRLNKILRQFYNSPIRNTPNNKIFENFWKLGDYQRIPYWRGCVYAFYLDNLLLKTTGRKTGIHEISLELKKLVHNRPGYEFTNEEFIQALSVYLPEKTVQLEFNEFIIEGKSIPLSEKKLLPEFQFRNDGEIPVLKLTNQKRFYANYQSR